MKNKYIFPAIIAIPIVLGLIFYLTKIASDRSLKIDTTSKTQAQTLSQAQKKNYVDTMKVKSLKIALARHMDRMLFFGDDYDRGQIDVYNEDSLALENMAIRHSFEKYTDEVIAYTNK